MEVHDRIRTEQAFHDRQARARAEFFRSSPDELHVSESQYLDHEPWIRPAMAVLGEVRGRRVLDFGCGPLDKIAVLQSLGYRCTGYDDLGDYNYQAGNNVEKILSFAALGGVEPPSLCSDRGRKLRPGHAE